MLKKLKLMVLWRPTRPFRTNTQKRCPFHYRGLECKSKKSRNTWSNRQIWPWSTEWSRAKANRVLPRERTAAAAAKLLQSCPILCDPIDISPPGSPVPGILQARTLEWVAISFSISKGYCVSNVFTSTENTIVSRHFICKNTSRYLWLRRILKSCNPAITITPEEIILVLK